MRNNSLSRKHCQPTWLQNTRLKHVHLANNFSYTISRVQFIATSCYSVLWRAYTWAVLCDCMIYGFSFHANGPAFVYMECSKQSFVLLLLFFFIIGINMLELSWRSRIIIKLWKNIQMDLFKDSWMNILIYENDEFFKLRLFFGLIDNYEKY